MSKENNLYTYEGPVMKFDTCIAAHWTGSTYAPSEKKARNNLAYQFKKENNQVASSKIILTGKIIKETI